MLGSSAFRMSVTPGGALAGPWVKNPLWSTARAVPSLDLPFADTKSLVDAVTGQSLVTFTRASSGTYVDSTGTLRTAAVNEPRFDHNPTTGESLGLPVEEQRTNLLLQSNGFGTTWTNSLTTETANAGTAPDGTNTAWELKDSVDASASQHLLSQTPASFVSGTAYTFSVWAKSGTLSHVALTFPSSAFASTLTTRYSLQTGTAVSVAPGTTATVTAFPNGWCRVTTTATATASASGVLTIRLALAGTTSYQGDGTGTILIWGAQLEAGAFPTSYIPTTTAAATRSADVATDTTRGTAIRTLYGQFRSPASGTRPIVSLDDNSANNRIELFTSGTDPKLLVTSGGSAQADIDAGAITANTTARLVARFNTDNFAASVSGGAEVLDATGTMPTVDRIRIGRDQAGNYLNGTIARITGWDSTLASLSQITQ